MRGTPHGETTRSGLRAVGWLILLLALVIPVAAQDFPSKAGDLVTAADLNRLMVRLGCPQHDGMFYPEMRITPWHTERVLECRRQGPVKDEAASRFVDDLIHYRLLPLGRQ